MPHSLTHILIHAIFSIKGREPLIDRELRPRLWAYVVGIVRESGGGSIAIGGTADHIHLLVSIPPTMPVADIMRLVKTNSSRWVHEEFPTRKSFAWQTGYAAFSVSASNVERVKRYIADQEEHHRKVTFQEEYVAFLKRHGVAYDERYLWD
jgi:REP element-mobilizing transposase RayT